jgi:two-component system, LytTR family, response regulator
MKQLRTIIIDDEPAAVASFEMILNTYCSHVEIVGTATSPYAGIKLINDLSPDLLLLDISMPEINGIELLKSIQKRDFAVIFVTAYNEFAVEAFKVNAYDYILKPINIPDFVKSINRVLIDRESKNSVKNLEALFNYYESRMVRKLVVSDVEGSEYIDHSAVRCIKAEGSYSVIYMENRKITTSRNLKDVQEGLSERMFFRCHNSWIVNLDHVTKYHSGDSYAEVRDNHKVPISRRNKEEFVRVMSNRFKDR